MNIAKKTLSWVGYLTAFLLFAFLIHSEDAISFIMN